MPTTKPYTIKTSYFLVHDKPKNNSGDREVLLNLFKDSHNLFKMRIQKLGNLEQNTTDEESHIMRTMLEGLIQAKKHLKK
jgi:hypothetical protein